jgi:hypothetical protein
VSAVPERSCADCRHFNGRPAEIEAALPGLSSLSSAYAAVRAEDGICAVHERYVTASSVCALHASATGQILFWRVGMREESLAESGQ